MANPGALGFQVDPARLTPAAARGVRTGLFVSAIVAVVLGVAIVVWPRASVAIVAFLFGLYFVVVGIVRLGKGLFAKSLGPGVRVLSIMLGVLLVIAGLFAMRYLEQTAELLGVIVGIAWIVEGIASLVESTTDGSRLPGILFGVLSLVAGVVVLFLPLQSVAVLVWVGGILLVVAGVVQFVQALRFGRQRKSETSPT